MCLLCSTPDHSIAPSDSISENTERTTKRSKSSVWEHFTVSETDPKKVICKHCPRHKNQFAYSNGGTKNLNNHLNSQHKAIINKESGSKPIIDYFKNKDVFTKAMFELHIRAITWGSFSFCYVAMAEEQLKEVF